MSEAKRNAFACNSVLKKITKILSDSIKQLQSSALYIAIETEVICQIEILCLATLQNWNKPDLMLSVAVYFNRR